MNLEICKPIVYILLFGFVIPLSSAEPIGEFSRNLEIKGQSIEWYEEFELKRNFSGGFVVSSEPQSSSNYSGTITDYTLTVNEREIDTENYLKDTYKERAINLTE